MPDTASPQDWLTARKALLAREKELTHAREALAEARRALPWVPVDKTYEFDGPDGKVTLADLFGGHSQLIVQHFMYAPDWEAGCKSCSFWSDSYDKAAEHLPARDTAMVAVAKAPFETIDRFRRRMGWAMTWASSANTDFNEDFHVSFTPEEQAGGEKLYNFGTSTFGAAEAPGVSVFVRDADGAIFHTYSCFARGLDPLNTTYQLLDLTPRGRDECDLPFTMAWLNLRDEYQS